jgi:1,4-dihydroxy-2-naphthoate octaprenyltransferase
MPVVAQQWIDASRQGGAAFLAFAIMCMLFVASLFYMDHIRQKREDQNR